MALHRACILGKAGKVRQLIQTGHDVNAYDELGWTPLLGAAYGGRMEVARELIRAKADVHLKVRESGRSALHIAAYYGHQSLVKLFLETEVNINEQDDEGRTALMLAVERGHSAVVAELVKEGADVSLKDKKGMTAVLFADRYDVVRPLVNDWCDLSNEEQNRVFWYACEGGDLRMVQSVLEFGCDVDHIHKGQTPLMMATLRGHDSIVKELILAGSNVNMQSHIYYTDVKSSVKMAVVFWPRVATWLAFLVALISPVSVGLAVEPKFGSVPGSGAAAMALVVALVGSLIVPGSGAGSLLGAGVIGIPVALLVVVAAVSGPGAWTMSIVMAIVANFIVQGRSVAVWIVVRGFVFLLCMSFIVKVREEIIARTGSYYLPALALGCFVIPAILYVAKDVAVSMAKKGIMAAALETTVTIVELIAVVVLAVAAVSMSVQWVGFAGIAGLQPMFMCGYIVLTMTSAKAGNATALHYAAGHNRIKCGVLLVEAGEDLTAKNKRLCTAWDNALERFVNRINQTWFFSTRKIIVVIGNEELGKSTLIAALEAESNYLCKRLIDYYFRKVRDIRQRTAGIEAIKFSSKKYGEALFYDFAGQSQYHGPHQSFLEAILSKPGASVTLLLLVKATEEEDIITQQLYRWLQPLALMSIPITPQVVVVGSFLDQVKSKKEASEKLLRCSQLVKTELALDIQGPCLLDCRRPVCKGINQLCILLKQIRPYQLSTGTLPYNLHWVMVQTRKAFSIPALQLHEFQTWLQDNVANLPRNLPSPEELCQDLTAAGHTLFLHNKQVISQSWLILDLPSILHNVYGTLFSGQGKVNQFGLLHSSQLTRLFPDLDKMMIQEVLSSLEFCIEIDPLLLKEELSQLTVDRGGEGWLYFPALVSAQSPEVIPEDPDPEQCSWLCWQLRTAEKHFISARLLQTIILRLAANHVFTHELAPRVRKHCCSVWVNGISWSSTKGVDIAIQISDNSVVQVVGRSMAEPQGLQAYAAAIIQDVTATITQLSPKLEAIPYILHPFMHESLRSPHHNTMYPVSSIVRCISNGDKYIPSLSSSTVPIDQLFGGELPSLTAVQGLSYPRVAPIGELTVTKRMHEDVEEVMVWCAVSVRDGHAYFMLSLPGACSYNH